MATAADIKGDNVARAVAAIIFAVLGLSLGDAVIKGMSVSFPLWQIYVVRSIIALPPLVGFILFRRPRVSLVPISVGWAALRSVLLATMWVVYYVALPHVPLSLAAAAYYTSPLFITLFAGLFAGERIGRLGWFAIVLGFAGVMVMLRPSAAGIDPYMLLPLVAAILYAAAMLLTRTKCRGEDPLVLSVALNVMFILFGAVGTAALMGDGEAGFLSGDWVSMGSLEWAALFVLAGAILVGSIFAAVAYQSGPSSTVATFDYSYLAFAVMWGLVFFGEIPGPLTLLGIAMIAGAGIIAVRR